MNFVKNFRHAMSDKNFKKKIGLVIIPIILYLVGSMIPLPNIDSAKLLNGRIEDLGALNMLRIMSGGQLQSFSLFTLGVSPIITSSIVLHLLSEVFVGLKELQTGGNNEKRKFNNIMLAVTLLLATLQGATTIMMFDREYGILIDNSRKGMALTLFVMLLGTLVLYGVSKWLEKKDIENGLTIFIATGIITSLPASIKFTLTSLAAKDTPMNILLIALYVAVYIAVIALIVKVSNKVVKVAVVSGKRVAGGGANIRTAEKKTYIPIPYNPSGVMPVIVASSVLTGPMIIASWVAPKSRTFKFFANTLSLNTYAGVITFMFLVILFAYVYNQIQINPEHLADEFKKNGTYIMGVRPGKDTERALRKEVRNVSKYSALFLVTVGVLPMFLPLITNGVISTAQAFGGTGMIILVDVIKEVVKSTETVGVQAKYRNMSRSSMWR